MTFEEIESFCKSFGMVDSHHYWGPIGLGWTFPGEKYLDKGFVRIGFSDRVEICWRNMAIKDKKVTGWVEEFDLDEDKNIKEKIEYLCHRFKELSKQIRIDNIKEL